MITYKNILTLLLACFAALTFNAQASEKEKNPDKSQAQAEKQEHEALNVQKMMSLEEMKAEAEKDAKKGSKVYPLLRALDKYIVATDCVVPILEYLAPDQWAVTSESKYARNIEDVTCLNEKLCAFINYSNNKALYLLYIRDNKHLSEIFPITEKDRVSIKGKLPNGDLILLEGYYPSNAVKLYTWNPKNKTILKSYELPYTIETKFIEVLTDGRIVTFKDTFANIYDLNDMKNPQHSLKFCKWFDEGSSHSMIQLSNGNMAIGYGNGIVKIFDLAGKKIHTLKHNKGCIVKIIELPHGMLAVGTSDTSMGDDHEPNYYYDHALYIWQFIGNEKKLIAKYGHDDDVNNMALLPDGRLITSTNYKIYIFNLSYLPQLIPEVIINYQNKERISENTLALLSQDTFATGDDAGFVRIWQRVPNHLVMAWQAYKEKLKRQSKTKANSCCAIM